MQESTGYAELTLNEMAGLEITRCDCGRSHSVPTREMVLKTGAINDLPEMIGRHIGPGAVLLVVDRNTWEACGARAKRLVENNGRQVEAHFVDRDSSPAHADQETVKALEVQIQMDVPAGLVAVGSGTINDVCKAAATRAKLPLITVATAASMNGYTSAIAALTVDGLKITDPCNPPAAIIADPEILSAAPRRMNAAGFGDLLSKNASTADWLLSHLLLDDYFCEVPVRVVERAVEESIQRAKGIRRNDPGGLEVLCNALLRSGISMVLAGSSSPASGGEHLISHLWDMTAHWTGRTPALHGEQTGVTTLISLALYEKLLNLDAKAIRSLKAEPAFASEAEMANALSDVFRELAPSILPQARKKYLDTGQLKLRRERIVSRWEGIRDGLKGVMISPSASRRYLRAAGAPVHPEDLGISGEELRFALRYARWIRNRYTVLDLAAEIGALETWEDEVLAAAGAV